MFTTYGNCHCVITIGKQSMCRQEGLRPHCSPDFLEYNKTEQKIRDFEVSRHEYGRMDGIPDNAGRQGKLR